MKIRALLSAITLIVASLALSFGCGGGSEAQSPSASEDAGITFSLRDGALFTSENATVFFPPRDMDLMMTASVSGGGSSPDDPISISLTASGESAASKSDSTSASKILALISINGTAQYEAGHFSSIYTNVSSGNIYSCSSSFPASGTSIQGAIVDNGQQYVGCIAIDPYDPFEANFFIDEGSVVDAMDDIRANILVEGEICDDGSCGELAIPPDMPRLVSVYQSPQENALLFTMSLFDDYWTVVTGYWDEDVRRDAYREMLRLLFTQGYLWEDYADRINEFNTVKVGFGELVDNVTVDVEVAMGLSEGADILVNFSPELVSIIKTGVMGWSKYANNRYVLDHTAPYFEAFSIAGGTVIAVGHAAFKAMLYQALAAGICSAQIYAFEERILPNVKDPAMRDAFFDVKAELIGAEGDGGILYDDLAALLSIAADLGVEEGRVLLGVFLEAAIANGLVATGVGAAAGAALGFPPTAIPVALAFIAVKGLEDRFSFEYERKITIAQATYMHNEFDAFSLFKDRCPESDGELADLLIAQHMFYSARLYFDLLHNSYTRWLVAPGLLAGDVPPALMEYFGFDSEGHLWTDPRGNELAELEEVYGAKAVKALEYLVGCTYDDDSEDPPVSCDDECSTAQKKCASGTTYTCITNGEGCRVWDGGTACPTGDCNSSNTGCEGCASAHHNGCYDDDVYSYDSCNVLEALVEDCGDDGWTGVTICQFDDVYQPFVDRGCSGASCTSSTANQKKQECGDAGCSGGACCASHASSQCYASDVYWYSSCNNREGKKQECGSAGCSGGSCCSSHHHYDCHSDDVYWYSSCNNREGKKQECGSAGCSGGSCCSSHHHYSCYSGDVWWYSSCNEREGVKQDCGTDTPIGDYYCQNNDVYRDYSIAGCSSNSCTTSTSSVKEEECGTGGCSDGVCCTSNDYYDCYGGDVWWYNSCDMRQDKKQDCGGATCTGGNCDCLSGSWNNNALSGYYSGGKVHLDWNAPSGGWASYYKVARKKGAAYPSENDSIATTYATDYIDSGCSSTETCIYRVFAYNACDQLKGTSLVYSRIP